MEANAAKSVQEVNNAKGSVHPGDVRRMMSKKAPPSNGKRAGNTVRWEVRTAQRHPPGRPPDPDSTPVSGSVTDSDAWGGDTVSTSSQSLPPSTSSKSTVSSDSTPDFFDTDLFGTSEHAAPSKSFPSKQQNPFTDRYDPFANLWAEDEEPHFW